MIMTIATDINLDTLTTSEAKLTLDKVIKQISEQTGEINIASDDIAIIAYALENNLQLRDYLMGLTSDGLSVESVAISCACYRYLLSLQNCQRIPSKLSSPPICTA
jgi:hypothetical protein